MEEIMTIPLLFLVGGVIAWCSWLTIRMFTAEKDIAVNTSNDQRVGEQIQSLKEDLGEKIDKLENHVNSKFEKINGKFDQVFAKIESLRK